MANDPIVLEPPTALMFADGFFTGAHGEKGLRPPGIVGGFNPNNAFWLVHAVTPKVAERKPLMPVSNKLLVYINGIMTLREGHAYTLKLLSVVTGARVIGIYNESGDGSETNLFGTLGRFAGDIVQSIGDKINAPGNPATATLTNAILDACLNGVYLNVVAHSQGAIITSHAVRNARRRLRDFYGRRDDETRRAMEHAERNRGVLNLPIIDRVFTSPDERRLNDLMRERIMPIVNRALDSYVTVQTFGGAAWTFPDGPRYRHVHNAYDPVARYFGQGFSIHDGGDNAQSVTLRRDSGSEGRGISDHSINDVYLQPSQYFVDREGRRIDTNYNPVDMNMVR